VFVSYNEAFLPAPHYTKIFLDHCVLQRKVECTWLKFNDLVDWKLYDHGALNFIHMVNNISIYHLAIGVGDLS
jgi:hypothetical protein